MPSLIFQNGETNTGMTGLSTVEFLSYLRRLNVKLSVDRDQLRLTAPTGVLTPDVHQELNVRKAELAQFLRAASVKPSPQLSVIERVSRNGELLLSFAQARLWLLEQMEPGSNAYNVPGWIRFKGDFNQAVFEQSLTELMRRHEALRSYYLNVDGRPVQKIAPAEPFRISVIDLQALPQTARYDEVVRVAAACASKPFNLQEAPMLRATLVKLAADEQVLFLDIHHIAFDGWSAGVLVRELSSTYADFLDGKASSLRDLPVQYVDFAAWQRRCLQGAALDAQLH